MTEPHDRRVIHKGSIGEDDLDDPANLDATSDDEDLADDDKPAHDDDDDDASRDSAADGTADDGAADRTRVRMHPGGRRRRMGPLLLLGAGALWAGAMMIRCRPTTLVPTHVPVAEPTVASPADSDPTTPATPTPGYNAPDDAAPGDADGDGAPPEPTPMGDGEARAQPDDVMPPEDGPTPDDDRIPVRRSDWADGLEIPTTVRYTIRRGGSLKNVANLFKIFHHEILELNPGIGIEQELPPNSRVVVYSHKAGEKSESIGYPSDGSLAGAVPMVEGPGRRVLAIGWKTWGKDTSIAMLDAVLDRWAARGASVQPILVGNIANRTGGRLEPHSTHQSGRDVDLGYPQKLAAGAELNWQEMNAANLDAAENWALLFLLGETGAVEEIYVDREIQKLLYDYAIRTELLSKSALAKWMEYPRPTGTPGTLLTHVAGHTDHLHVRWLCAQGDSRCRTR